MQSPSILGKRGRIGQLYSALASLFLFEQSFFQWDVYIETQKHSIVGVFAPLPFRGGLPRASFAKAKRVEWRCGELNPGPEKSV